MKRGIFILFALLGMQQLHAQDIALNASAPAVVAVGEQFRLTFEINARPKQFNPPDIPDFQVLMGPSTSSSQSVSIVNGKMTQNYSYTYTYVLRANKEGKFRIQPAMAKVDGDEYLSKAIEIQVVKGSASQQQSSGTNQASESLPAGIDDKDLFVRLIVDRKSIYQGEHVIATVKLYSKINISGIEEIEFPTFDGFLKQDIETAPLRSLEREVIDGEIYGTGVLQKVVLFPQRNGSIKIDPVKIVCSIQKRSAPQSIFDDFFGSYQTIPKEINSSPISINVKPLPENKPESFTGAVGNFNFEATIDKNKVKTNDAITLKLNISGNGNIRLADAPSINFPSDFEVYDPKTTQNIKNTQYGSSGVKTIEYLMIPRYAGNFIIPSIEFGYFDPSAGKYITKKAGPFTINVEKGENDESATIVSGFSKEDVKYIGKDIRFIKTNPMVLLPFGNTFFGSKAFYMAYLIPFLIFILFAILKRKQIKDSQNITQLKNRKANKYALKRLKSAKSFLASNDKEKFYEETARALWGYLSDKLSIPMANLSKDNASENLRNKNVAEDLIIEFNRIIDECEFARFAPSTGHSEMDKTYRDALSIISKLQQNIK